MKRWIQKNYNDGAFYRNEADEKLSDVKKYIKKSDIPEENLKNIFNLSYFPEYELGYDFIVTNTGLIGFKNGTNLIIYDMFDNDETQNIKLSDIIPDYTVLKSFTHLTTPLAYRSIKFAISKNDGDMTGFEFLPKLILSKGKDKYYEINSDTLNGVEPEENGLFKITSNDNSGFFVGNDIIIQDTDDADTSDDIYVGIGIENNDHSTEFIPGFLYKQIYLIRFNFEKSDNTLSSDAKVYMKTHDEDLKFDGIKLSSTTYLIDLSNLDSSYMNNHFDLYVEDEFKYRIYGDVEVL